MAQVIGICESCGRDDEVIVRVRRLYVTPDSWESPQQIRVDEEEVWCFSCRTHYPHELLDESAGEDS